MAPEAVVDRGLTIEGTVHAIVEVIVGREAGLKEGGATGAAYDLLHKVTELLQSTLNLHDKTSRNGISHILVDFSGNSWRRSSIIM